MIGLCLLVCLWPEIRIGCSRAGKLSSTYTHSGALVHGHQLYMAVLVWYFVIRDLSSVRYYKVAYTCMTFCKVPEQHGHVYLVGLYQLQNKLLPSEQINSLVSVKIIAAIRGEGVRPLS